MARSLIPALALLLAACSGGETPAPSPLTGETDAAPVKDPPASDAAAATRQDAVKDAAAATAPLVRPGGKTIEKQPERKSPGTLTKVVDKPKGSTPPSDAAPQTPPADEHHDHHEDH